MATSTPVRTRMVIEFQGEGERSGGSYSNSNIKMGALDTEIYQTASAINNLQAQAMRGLFKVTETELES